MTPNINLTTTGQNNGTATSVFVRNVGSGGVRTGFVRFDLFCLPAGVTITQATLAGPPGPQGPPGPAGSGSSINPLQVAQLRWYEGNDAGNTFLIDPLAQPRGMAFDGAHIWVSSHNNGTVSKL